MKTVITLFLINNFMSCDSGSINSERTLLKPVSSQTLQVSFMMTDTMGQKARIFRVGEKFDAFFKLVNSSNEELNWLNGEDGPDAVFLIMKDNTLITSSINDRNFSDVIVVKSLKPGQELDSYWRGPDIQLVPGSYRLNMKVAFFNSIRASEIEPISFVIIE